MPAMGMMPAFGKADKMGAFTLDRLAPASYELMLPMLPEGTYLKSVLFNDRETIRQPLNLTAAGNLRIILGTDGGNVDVRVSLDSKPAPSATVVLLPTDPERRVMATVRKALSNASGSVALKDVAPGDYIALAWEQVEDGLWFDAEFVKAAQGQAVSVHVGPRANERIELKLIPAAR